MSDLELDVLRTVSVKRRTREPLGILQLASAMWASRKRVERKSNLKDLLVQYHDELGKVRQRKI